MARMSQKGDAPLLVAVDNMDIDSVKRLLAEGANPNVRGKINRTPLHIAAGLSQYPKLAHNTEIYNELLLAGADQNLTDDYGHVPDNYLRWSKNLPNFEKKRKEFNTLQVAAILNEIHPEGNAGSVYDQLDVDTMKDFNDYSAGKKRRKTIRRRKTIKRRKTTKRRVKRARK